MPSHPEPEALLAWYDQGHRALPWRSEGGVIADPYHVWLSEIMLQQTTVAAVKPYYRAFLEQWPTVHDLAKAPDEAVMTAWAGLGYYARARNLLACARLVARWRNGRFPEDEAGLRELPGVGAYTAAAIAAIAFGKRAVVVDGNVERVMARLFAVTVPLPSARSELRRLADSLTPHHRPGDYAQAVMDLGATLCTPRNPACGLCPWRAQCEGLALGLTESLPARAFKPPRPIRRGVAFWTTSSDGSVLLRLRPAHGLLGGMMEVPCSDWKEGTWTADTAMAEAPLPGSALRSGWRSLPGVVLHGFTHFQLELTVVAGITKAAQPPVKGIWCPLDRLGEQALPTVMKKVVRHALAKTT